jgi:catabolite regulation protein CreA
MKHKRKRDKKYDQRIHFKKRVKQRYDLEINRFVYQQLVDQIQDGQAEFIQKQSNRISVFWVMYDDIRIRVIYDKSRKTLVTALPPDGEIEWEIDDE